MSVGEDCDEATTLTLHNLVRNLPKKDPEKLETYYFQKRQKKAVFPNMHSQDWTNYCSINIMEIGI